MYEKIKYCGSGKFVSSGEWIHPNRVVDSYELIFVISGSVYITEDNTQYHLEKNHMLLLEPGLRHYGYRKSTDTSFFWVHFTGEFKINQKLKRQFIPESYHLSLLFKQLLHYRAENYSVECLNYLTRLILIEVFTLRETEGEKNRIASEIAAWIVANRHCAVKVERVAEHFGYNADYICRIFKKSYEKSLKAYIDEVRLNYIKDMLIAGNMTLSDIAANTGFTDYKYFLKFFKYHEGITPVQFMKSYPQTHINIK